MREDRGEDNGFNVDDNISCRPSQFRLCNSENLVELENAQRIEKVLDELEGESGRYKQKSERR